MSVHIHIYTHACVPMCKVWDGLTYCNQPLCYESPASLLGRMAPMLLNHALEFGSKI